MKVDKPTLSQLFDCYGDLLTQKQRQCFDLYCNQDDSLAEIAELMGTSRQGVYDAVRRAEQQLLRFERVALCLAHARRDRSQADALQRLSDRLRTASFEELPELAHELAVLAESLRRDPDPITEKGAFPDGI